METLLMPPELRPFALRLRELRKESGLSQTELADAAGMSASGLRQIEQGKREPTFETVQKLATALGVSLAVFDRPVGKKRADKTKGDD